MLGQKLDDHDYHNYLRAVEIATKYNRAARRHGWSRWPVISYDKRVARVLRCRSAIECSLRERQAQGRWFASRPGRLHQPTDRFESRQNGRGSLAGRVSRAQELLHRLPVFQSAETLDQGDGIGKSFSGAPAAHAGATVSRSAATSSSNVLYAPPRIKINRFQHKALGGLTPELHKSSRCAMAEQRQDIRGAPKRLPHCPCVVERHCLRKMIRGQIQVTEDRIL